MALTPAERDLCTKLDFELAVGEMLKAASNKPVEQMKGAGDGGEWAPVAGLSARATEETAQQVLTRLQPQLPEGYEAFYSERNAAGDTEVALLKTTDRFDIMRLKATDGANYDLSTDDIIARLQQWQQLCQLNIVGAGHDWVFVEFETLPDDINAFGEEVYDFCPDTIDQHFGSFGDMGEAMEEAGEELPEDVRKLMEDLDWSDPDAAGMKLLKCSLIGTKSLFLWWD